MPPHAHHARRLGLLAAAAGSVPMSFHGYITQVTRLLGSGGSRPLPSAQRLRPTYGESDLAFGWRLLVDEGWCCHFEHAAGEGSRFCQPRRLLARLARGGRESHRLGERLRYRWIDQYP